MIEVLILLAAIWIAAWLGEKQGRRNEWKRVRPDLQGLLVRAREMEDDLAVAARVHNYGGSE